MVLKKACFAAIFLISVALFSFAQEEDMPSGGMVVSQGEDMPSGSMVVSQEEDMPSGELVAGQEQSGISSSKNIIFIEGTAQNREQLDYFMDNFTMEAMSLGFSPTDNRAEARYVFRFDVFPNMIEYDDGTTAQAPPDEPQLAIQVTFFNNADDTELVTFIHLFTELEEMYEHNQYLFYRAFVLIPPEEEQDYSPQSIYVMAEEDNSWANKWLYLRASLDYHINFYLINPDTQTIHNQPEESKSSIILPQENKTVAWPGITLGVEVQLLDWMSIEPKVHLGSEKLYDNIFFTLTAGLNVKFPLKMIKNIMLEPYVSGVLPLSVPFLDTKEIIRKFPTFGIGGGIQIGLKAGKPGVLFFDISYMHYFGDAAVSNLHTIKDNPTYPAELYYQRTVIGLGIGYKFGLFDRK